MSALKDVVVRGQASVPPVARGGMRMCFLRQGIDHDASAAVGRALELHGSHIWLAMPRAVRIPWPLANNIAQALADRPARQPSVAVSRHRHTTVHRATQTRAAQRCRASAFAAMRARADRRDACRPPDRLTPLTAAPPWSRCPTGTSSSMTACQCSIYRRGVVVGGGFTGLRLHPLGGKRRLRRAIPLTQTLAGLGLGGCSTRWLPAQNALQAPAATQACS